jgi:hypothetical protein
MEPLGDILCSIASSGTVARRSASSWILSSRRVSSSARDGSDIYEFYGLIGIVTSTQRTEDLTQRTSAQREPPQRTAEAVRYAQFAEAHRMRGRRQRFFLQ